MKYNIGEITAEFGFGHFAVSRRGEGFLVICLMPFSFFDSSGQTQIVPYYFASQKGHTAFEEMLAHIRTLGFSAEPAGKMNLKQTSMKAGLGFIGKNTLCISDKFGSDFSIFAFITDMPCETTDYPVTARKCGSCDKCAKACPTGALDGEGGFSRDKCLRNYMLAGTAIPEHLRENMGNMLLGCNICQDACPFNSKRNVVETPSIYHEITELLPMLDYENDPLKEKRQEIIGKNYARAKRLCAQVLIAAGNSGREDLLPVIKNLEKNENSAIADHAKWAKNAIEQKSK